MECPEPPAEHLEPLEAGAAAAAAPEAHAVVAATTELVRLHAGQTRPRTQGAEEVLQVALRDQGGTQELPRFDGKTYTAKTKI